MLWIFLIGILTVNLLSRYNQIESIGYEEMFPKTSPFGSYVKNQKVMVLADDSGIYRQNRLGGYFFDWGLSRRILEKPFDFSNILLVQHSLETGPPDTIIDPQGLMKPFFEKLPAWKAMYVRDSVYYRKLSDTRAKTGLR